MQFSDLDFKCLGCCVNHKTASFNHDKNTVIISTLDDEYFNIVVKSGNSILSNDRNKTLDELNVFLSTLS